MAHQTDIERLAAFCRSHGIRRAALFGSLDRGEGRPDSDLDLLVTSTARKSLLAVVRLERELGVELGRRVDLLVPRNRSARSFESESPGI